MSAFIRCNASRYVFLFILLFLPAWQLGAEKSVFSLVVEFDRLAAKPLWPGFDARKTPLELYDGVNTYLVRHPAAPKEFAPVKGHPDFMVYSGRHSTMRANTSIEIAGVMTATLYFDHVNPHIAAVLVHECFHVFQAREHPTWIANEAVLFTYPFEDATALALARLEMEALSRALSAPSPKCWAERAMTLRRERFAKMPAEAVAYERGTELHEGLAQFVDGLAEGRKEVKFRTFAPDEFRSRSYKSGEAIARLLDRLNPEWKSKVADSLEDLLLAGGTDGCDFTAAERTKAEAQAREDIEKLKKRHSELLQAFNSQPGWRITVEPAGGKPLWPDAFDPMNVTRLSEKVILHRRWLQLKNDYGSIEIINHASITEAAGAHPLYNGVRRWSTAGLTTKPEIKQEGSFVSMTSPVCNMAFINADVQWQPQAVIIRIR